MLLRTFKAEAVFSSRITSFLDNLQETSIRSFHHSEISIQDCSPYLRKHQSRTYLSKNVFIFCVTGKTSWRLTLDNQREHHWWRMPTRISFVYFLISDEQSISVERRDESVSYEQARRCFHSTTFFPRARAIEVCRPAINASLRKDSHQNDFR